MFFRVLGIFLFMIFFGFCGCMRYGSAKPQPLDQNDEALVRELKIDGKVLAKLKSMALFQLSERDLDVYLRYLQKAQPELALRIALLARKNIGQPYRSSVSGEYPFEIYDSNPLFRMDQSDTLGFVESTYAMALGYNWPSFMAFPISSCRSSASLSTSISSCRVRIRNCFRVFLSIFIRYQSTR